MASRRLTLILRMPSLLVLFCTYSEACFSIFLAPTTLTDLIQVQEKKYLHSLEMAMIVFLWKIWQNIFISIPVRLEVFNKLLYPFVFIVSNHENVAETSFSSPCRWCSFLILPSCLSINSVGSTLSYTALYCFFGMSYLIPRKLGHMNHDREKDGNVAFSSKGNTLQGES